MRLKIDVEVDLQPEEIPLATELFSLLRQMSTFVKPTNTVEIFKKMISKAEDPALLESVSTDINTFLQDLGQEGFTDFSSAFESIVFDPQIVAANKSVVPFFLLLQRISDPHKGLIRDSLIPKVLKFLTLSRPLDVDRMEFFAHAEAFAALVKIEFVSITGAVTTISTLLHKLETRCAAVTMLGKTVELCLPFLNERCDAAELEKLRLRLDNVTEEVFQYDINYIEDNMKWRNKSPVGKPAEPVVQPQGRQSLTSSVEDIGNLPVKYSMAVPNVGANQPLPTLAAKTSFIGHTNVIFTICYDEAREQLISSGKDGAVIVWNKDGKQKEVMNIPKHYACSMDLHPKHRTICLSGVSKEGGTPAIIGYNLNEKIVHRGTLEKPSSKLVSCVKALVDSPQNIFVTGESSKTERVHVYDATTTPFDQLTPVCSYEEHTDIITCLAQYPRTERLFFSGSRDCSIKLWDTRQARSAATFGYFNPTTNQTIAHELMITCLDASENILVSAGLDKTVLIWDLRSFAANKQTQPVRKIPVDNFAVLKVAIGPSALTAAVSTLKGLYLVDFTSGTVKPASKFADGRKMRKYHDLKWNSSFSVLYAAGDDMRIDQFTVQ